MILQDFIPALKFVSACMAKQAIKYYLNGVLVEPLDDFNIRLVATDGHRLARVVIKSDNKHGIPKGQYIIPAINVTQIIATFKFSKRHIFDTPIKISIDENGLGACVESLGNTITFLFVDGKYPDYERVLPKDPKEPLVDAYNIEVGLNAKYIHLCMKGCTHIANNYEGVKMTVRGENTAVLFEVITPEQSALSEALVILMPMRL